MRKIYLIRVILIILILIWMSVIFGFSSENGETSQSLSDRITIKVVHIIEPDYKELSVNSQKAVFDKVSFIVRKTGHFCEYGVLGSLIVMLIYTFEKMRLNKKWKNVLFATVFAMIYACTDEFHQGFVDGRSPRVIDVIIDSCGAVAGAFVTVKIYYLINKIRNN